MYINSVNLNMSIHKEEVERSIANQFGALTSCREPLELWLVSIRGKRVFEFKDLFHQTHVNNIVHLNHSRCFYKMLFKRSWRQMGMVVREPTLIKVPKDLNSTINKDRKEVAVNDDARMARAFDIDMVS